ncbi:DNA-binding FadR family transcriptional regulator [Micromonospora olivasterospora]|uniref:DNA-binding FadR family transcriptional regulator n=1 Tax=Micromonospora olivasterospora TaxID=1880 RepID=A0A562IGS6_MICOL|nr:DNA-binding FadR family transcriptional regulator [Micromonospora olivasterospora]
MWNALIDRMDDNGIITASLSALAEATSTPQPTVRHRIGVLRDRGLLQRVQEGHAGVAARYGVSDPGQPRQAPLPAPPEGSQWLRDPGEARALFDQHAGHIATTTPQPEQLWQLWNALIDRMDDNGIITASEPDLAEATSTPQRTVRARIGVLRDRGLLQRVQGGRGRVAARYGVSDPGQPRQAPLPAPPEGSQWLRDPGEARALFDQHAGHIATTTPQPEQLWQLWNALIDRMDDNGIITASEPALAEATSTPQQTVHARIGVLRDRALLQLVQEAHGRVAARYGVSDPGQPRQAPLPAPPEGSQWLRDPGEARALFDQHAGHIATTTRQPEQLRQLWNALIDRMDDNGIITASEPALAEATSTPRPTVRHRIGVLRDRGLLQLVQEAHGRVAARYGVSDPGQPRQAPLPGPALGPDRPQGEDLSWLDHGATVPMPGPAPAPPAGTGLPGLPGPFDPDALTASSWQAGWAEPGWPVPGMGVTDGHGAAISTDFDQPGIDDQASDGGNLGDWATYKVDPAGSLDVDPADLLYLLEAVGTEPDPGPQPMDPPRPQAPPGPTSWSQLSGDQPSQSPGTQ